MVPLKLNPMRLTGLEGVLELPIALIPCIDVWAACSDRVLVVVLHTLFWITSFSPLVGSHIDGLVGVRLDGENMASAFCRISTFIFDP